MIAVRGNDSQLRARTRMKGISIAKYAQGLFGKLRVNANVFAGRHGRGSSDVERGCLANIKPLNLQRRTRLNARQLPSFSSCLHNCTLYFNHA